MNSIVLSIIIAVVLSNSAHPTRRCACYEPPLQQAIRDSDTIFLAKVMAIQYSKDERKPEIRFDVSNTWKGSSRPMQIVYTNSGDWDCGFTFVNDSVYVVFAKLMNNKLYTFICTRTALASAAQADQDSLNVLFGGR
jgi:hypothetical protein